MVYVEMVYLVMALVGRYGHNELDQPMFTQPLLYSKIAKQPTALSL